MLKRALCSISGRSRLLGKCVKLTYCTQPANGAEASQRNLIKEYGLTKMQVGVLHGKVGNIIQMTNPQEFDKLLERPENSQIDLLENLNLLKICGFSETNRKSLLLRSMSVFAAERKSLESTIQWYLKDLGVSVDEFNRIVVQYPPLLNFDEEKLSTFLSVFLDAGFSKEQVRSLVVRNPESVGRSWAAKVNPMLIVFRQVGFGRLEFVRLVDKTPHVLRGTQQDRAELIECLQEAGLTDGQVQNALTRNSELLIHSFKSNLKPKLEFFTEIVKIPKETVVKKIMVRAAFSFARVRINTIRNSYKTFLDLGFDRGSYEALICSSPFILGQGSKNIQQKVEFAVGFLKRDLSEISRWPAYLTFSLEDRIMFRVAAMCAKGQSVASIGFRPLLHPGDDGFFSKYEKGFYTKFSRWWKGLSTEAKWHALERQAFI